MKELIVYYSIYVHVRRMAEAMAVSEKELAAARFQGKHMATLAARLAR